MENKSTFEVSTEGVIYIHYTEDVTLENQTTFLAELRAKIADTPAFKEGVELLIDMSRTKSFSSEAQVLSEHFVRDIKILRAAVYGASLEMKAIRERFYTNAGKSDKTHYFDNRDSALAWLIAERVANNTQSIMSETKDWSIMLNGDPRYTEIIYATDVNIENQNRLMNDFEDFSLKHKHTPNGQNVLIDLSKTKSFSDGAQFRASATLNNTPIRRIANFGATPPLTIVRKEFYKTAGAQEGISRYFDTREEALAWLLSE